VDRQQREQMSQNIDFDFGESAGAAGAEEVLYGSDSARRPQRPRRRIEIPDRVWVGAGILALIVALVVDVRRGHETDRSAQATASASLAQSVEVPSLQVALTGIALSAARLTDNIRASALTGCPSPHGGVSSRQAQLTALSRSFPKFGPPEVSQTIDASEELCAVTLRARDDQSDVIIVRIAAPPNDKIVELNLTNNAGPAAYPYFIGAAYVTDRGFSVQVGVLGKEGSAASGFQVDQLVEDPALTW
jgi:hypothetical protein